MHLQPIGSSPAHWFTVRNNWRSNQSIWEGTKNAFSSYKFKYLGRKIASTREVRLVGSLMAKMYRSHSKETHLQRDWNHWQVPAVTCHIQHHLSAGLTRIPYPRYSPPHPSLSEGQRLFDSWNRNRETLSIFAIFFYFHEWYSFSHLSDCRSSLIKQQSTLVTWKIIRIFEVNLYS